jgi:hypothetical protein
MRILSWNTRGLGDDEKNETIWKVIDDAKGDKFAYKKPNYLR